ncbi:MAG TPA: PhzF family phenazine biosynthesis protein [Thermomonospora sp.]|nr:PhzF family phenazine biosynthesis protein [Thermomonospora sp.]
MRLLVVDAFTDRPFSGNPAGVCLLPGPADPGWMQLVAAEMRHAETAFVRRLADLADPADPDDPGADYELRWFTPAVEVRLCGHATLAAAHALFETGEADPARPLRFRTLHSGVLTARPGSAGMLEMEFPATPPRPIEEPPGLAAALGVPVTWTGRSDQDDVLAVVADEDAVRALTPDLDALVGLDARGVCVTAPATGDPDFVSRFFAPRVGVPEDPVTGSTHCMLGPYWAGRLGRTALTGHQASPRGGRVHVTVTGDRAVLAGHAVTVLDGALRDAAVSITETDDRSTGGAP